MENSTSERRFTGWHMLGMLGLFFGTIIAVNLTLAYFAVHTWSGLVVENSYVASQHFNEEQEKARAHAELGWDAGVAYEDGRIAFFLADANGKGILSDNVTAKVMRPANEGHDVTVQLVPAGGGRYVADQVLGAGQWVVEVFADAGLDTPYRYAKRIYVGPEAATK
ncbi:MAG: FixH family protein [Notoacmeibacter sp.]|nr:FixH family protein [Notoacmeibacter sp.]